MFISDNSLSNVLFIMDLLCIFDSGHLKALVSYYFVYISIAGQQQTRFKCFI